jgi:hypothetical protein
MKNYLNCKSRLITLNQNYSEINSQQKIFKQKNSFKILLSVEYSIKLMQHNLKNQILKDQKFIKWVVLLEKVLNNMEI